MTQHNVIKLFEAKKVRTIWDDKAEKWYFSIVDVVAVLTDSIDATAYWRKLKQRLKAEGSETVTNCHGLKMMAADGYHLSDLERYDSKGVQTPQGLKEREPARQHDQQGTGAQYAGRTIYKRNI